MCLCLVYVCMGGGVIICATWLGSSVLKGRPFTMTMSLISSSMQTNIHTYSSNIHVQKIIMNERVFLVVSVNNR